MKKVNVEKWCVANEINVVNVLKMLKQSKVVVYVIGAAHYVDAEEVLEQAISGSCERQKQSHEKRVENGKKLANNNKRIREYLMDAAVKGSILDEEELKTKIAELKKEENGPQKP